MKSLEHLTRSALMKSCFYIVTRLIVCADIRNQSKATFCVSVEAGWKRGGIFRLPDSTTTGRQQKKIQPTCVNLNTAKAATECLANAPPSIE